MATALLLGTPFFIFFGWLSDRIGRKFIILGGCALAAATYFPAFHLLSVAANPALIAATESAAITVSADPRECSFQFDPVGKNRFDTTSCDIAKSWLARAGVNYRNVAAPPGAVASISIGALTLAAPDPARISGAERAGAIKAYGESIGKALADAGYPAKADPARIDRVAVVAVLFYLVLLVTMVYGPIAAMLVELFPSRIRYTSMSLPYHIGNGWFGGFLPTTAFAMVAATGNIYYGLWYPVVVAALTVVVGLIFLPETFRRRIDQ